MSQFGQKWPTLRGLSGPPPRADITRGIMTYAWCEQETHGTQLTASSFDHLVGLREDGRRYGKAKHFGSLEVDHQIELRGLLRGQAGRVGALEELIDVAHGATVLIRVPRTIEHQEPLLGISLPEGRPWQLVTQREFHNLANLGGRER